MFQVWRHKSGEHYLVKLDDGGAVIGAYGSLRTMTDKATGRSEATVAVESPENFELSAEDADWINENQSEFSHVEDCAE